jgi:ribonuclease HII
MLAPDRRTEVFDAIWRMSCAIGVGWVGSSEIDQIGLGAANLVALRRAIGNLGVIPDGLVIDHFHLSQCPQAQICVPRADALSLSVAAASVVAKVLRDRWMQTAGAIYPGYGFELHKGYGTRSHREALQQLGVCEIHRLSFAPLSRVAE